MEDCDPVPCPCQKEESGHRAFCKISLTVKSVSSNDETTSLAMIVWNKRQFLNHQIPYKTHL